MEKLYSWCTSLVEKLESSDYVEDYFVETSVCINVFIVGFISALLIAVIYYFIICNKSFALAKRYFWAITVFVTFLTFSYHFLMRLTVGFFTGFIPDKLLNPENKWFSPKKSEKKIYKVLKVKKWKILL